MTLTDVGVFATTLQKTHGWLEDLMRQGQLESEAQAYTALRAVLHALRDRLIVDEAVDLGAQLPMLIRGFYYEGWDPSRTPLKYRTVDEFLDHIRRDLRNAALNIDAEAAARAVFALLRDKVTQGEIEDVREMLPGEIQELWPR